MTNDNENLHKPYKYLLSPKYNVIERTAAELAATWYEIGRGQGMTSKWKSPKTYARANFEKFIPKAVELLLSMLGRSDIAELMKQEIYEALLERHNDPELVGMFPNIPNIDISKILPKHDRIPDVTTTVLHNLQNPYKAKRH